MTTRPPEVEAGAGGDGASQALGKGALGLVGLGGAAFLAAVILLTSPSPGIERWELLAAAPAIFAAALAVAALAYLRTAPGIRPRPARVAGIAAVVGLLVSLAFMVLVAAGWAGLASVG